VIGISIVRYGNAYTTNIGRINSFTLLRGDIGTYRKRQFYSVLRMSAVSLKKRAHTELFFS
jgi:hypothetical protein